MDFFLEKKQHDSSLHLLGSWTCPFMGELGGAAPCEVSCQTGGQYFDPNGTLMYNPNIPPGTMLDSECNYADVAQGSSLAPSSGTSGTSSGTSGTSSGTSGTSSGTSGTSSGTSAPPANTGTLEDPTYGDCVQADGWNVNSFVRTNQGDPTQCKWKNRNTQESENVYASCRGNANFTKDFQTEASLKLWAKNCGVTLTAPPSSPSSNFGPCKQGGGYTIQGFHASSATDPNLCFWTDDVSEVSKQVVASCRGNANFAGNLQVPDNLQTWAKTCNVKLIAPPSDDITKKPWFYPTVIGAAIALLLIVVLSFFGGSKK